MSYYDQDGRKTIVVVAPPRRKLGIALEPVNSKNGTEEEETGAWIAEILLDSILFGRVAVGDTIAAIDGVNVTSASIPKIIALLKSSSSKSLQSPTKAKSDDSDSSTRRLCLTILAGDFI